MAYHQVFVSAMISTALIVAIARLLLSFVLKKQRNYVPSLCVGLGYLLGRYSVSGPLDDPDTQAAIAALSGSAACLVIFGAGFLYQAKRTTVA
jgi:hypothetical protein